ncbi:MAG: nucleotide sugar dehydrogenase [Planctomycetota bacterium]
MTATESTEQRLAHALKTRDAIIGVVGLGYVGLPLAHAAHAAGFRVIGFDVDQAKIDHLAAGRTYLDHLGDSIVQDLSASDRFRATSDLSELSEPDVISVCVPTPIGAHREPDLRYVVDTAKAIGRALRRGQLLVLESTTYPGTTRDDFLPALQGASPSGDLEPGRDFFVAYSPEREDPGRKSHSTRTIPKTVGGLDEASTELAQLFYSACVEQVHPVSSPEVAEAGKLLENIFRSVNIALVNEMKTVFAEMGIDIWEVIDAAASKPFGFMPFYPGPGLGGHCIPIDPFYLTWKAKEIGRPTRFIELAGEINTEMPAYVVHRSILALNESRRAIAGARVLILGLAYKPNVNDTRESPAFELIERFSELGADVEYSDPFIPETVPVRKHDLRMKSVELTPESVASFDLIVVVTNHDAFDYDLIAAHAQKIVDTRNAMRPYRDQLGGRLVLA